MKDFKHYELKTEKNKKKWNETKPLELTQNKMNNKKKKNNKNIKPIKKSYDILKLYIFKPSCFFQAYIQMFETFFFF